jgi:hypothetical protein
MALVIEKDKLPGQQATGINALAGVRFLVSPSFRERLIDKAGNMWNEYVEDIKALPYTIPEAIESYKDDLRSVGVNNAGDFAKWTLLNIAGAGILIIGAKILSIGGAALWGLGAVGKFAVSTLGIMAAFTAAPMAITFLQQSLQLSGQVINFDINQTDDQLYKQLEQRMNSMYGLLGTAVGSAMGWLVCGALPNSVAFKFNKAVATAIAQDLDEEARQELYSHIGSIIRLSSQTLINTELVNRFTSTRRELKRNPDSAFAKFIRKVIGEERFKKWGDANQQPWTIKKDIIDKQGEKIKDPNWKLFYDNTLEGFSDSCMEASFIVANNIDTYIATQKIARSNTLGKIQTVRIRINEGIANSLRPPTATA